MIRKIKMLFTRRSFGQIAALAAAALFAVLLSVSETSASGLPAAQEYDPAAAGYQEDPAAFILNQMRNNCFASLWEDEDMVCFGEMTGEDFAVLSLKLGEEERIWGGDYVIDENEVTITDAVTGEQIRFFVGHDEENPFVITIPAEFTDDGEVRNFAISAAPSELLAAAAERSDSYPDLPMASHRDLSGWEILSLYRKYPLYVLLSFIDEAWERHEQDGTEIVYALSGNKEFACKLQMDPTGKVTARAGLFRSISRPEGLLLKTDRLLPGQLMLYTDGYIDFITGACEYKTGLGALTNLCYNAP